MADLYALRILRPGMECAQRCLEQFRLLTLFQSYSENSSSSCIIILDPSLTFPELHVHSQEEQMNTTTIVGARLISKCRHSFGLVSIIFIPLKIGQDLC